LLGCDEKKGNFMDDCDKNVIFCIVGHKISLYNFR
jgi:hypothetical protein